MGCPKAEELLHSVPPTNLLNALDFLRQSTDDDVSDFANTYRIPFILVEPLEGKAFLACSYNLKNGRHRSPWDNNLYPKEEECGSEADADFAVDKDMRNLEITFNEVWRAYATLYYGHESVASAYIKPTPKGPFECLFGVQKICSFGSWNSASHVIVADPVDGECSYHVETVVQCVLQPETKVNSDDKLSISAIVSKTTERSCKLPSKVAAAVIHMENIGTIIESAEIDLRSNLETVLIPKNQQAIDSVLSGKTPNVHNGVNPIMDMVMNSEMLKRRLANTQT